MNEMSFSPKLIVADVSLIISIALGLFIQKASLADDVKIGLVILAGIFLMVSVVINLVVATQRRKEKRQK
ncbi:hypothetical protein FC51_GL002017 [Lentilactobacillus parabuchneri DSM 5707 = NBRC 107865]|uniref:Uncharacterized protein n=2 Tax=Lentilactobacillus parabuchneri TaxID=152331 RepID=A0A0R1YW38_9LACO|nr:hypothetical protein FC51_GL002017 [Lentilactobacillus parabuchneri DSM 5707 = NBRC 107865]KRN71856.1 hypothetical protein IV42_GL001449 [Lentilactobacillus parabuchneri]